MFKSLPSEICDIFARYCFFLWAKIKKVLSCSQPSVVDTHRFDADLDADPDWTYHPDADSVADPDYDFLFVADPDPTFHPDADADPDPDPSFKEKPQTLVKVQK